MRSLIIADVHNRIEKVNAIVARENPDEVILLGDLWDSWDSDSLEHNEATTRWAKARLRAPGWHVILGNHDAQYRWPKNNWLRTNCYTQEKCNLINSILTKEDWREFSWAVNRGNWWMSHAGLCPQYFFPMQGFSEKNTYEILARAEADCNAGIWNGVSDTARGDLRCSPSGPLWLRWSCFEAIPDINQIVGHTNQNEPAEILGENSRNLNIDTQNQFYVVLENNNALIKEL